MHKSGAVGQSGSAGFEGTPIDHIEDYEVFKRIHDHFSEIPDEEWEPHYLYKLGPAIVPSHEVRNGGVYPSGHNWCMLDTLLTCKTISEARDLSEKRAKLTEHRKG